MENGDQVKPDAKPQNVDGPVNDQAGVDYDPILPPELEQRIFQMAFRDDENMKNPFRLLFVAKRVFEWLIPLLYEVVVRHPSKRWPPVGISFNLPKYGKYVRHVLLETIEAEGMEYLTHCRNINDLAIISLPDRFKPDQLDALTTLPLQRICIDIRVIPESPLTSALFAKITHLDIACFTDWESLSPNIISQFTSLTHLMMLGDDSMSSKINSITKHLPKLKLFLVISYTYQGNIVERPWKNESSDPRVVTLSCSFVQHWMAAAQGFENPWSFGEDILAKRQQSGGKSEERELILTE
ncbi:hypothetical protein BDN72DRAFT_956201 [Pluteus cervinus]|uniref:Uncharacterized protein n=1 Tax=Pluteus cervinus TaxID=181527 RepID=A0ACD3B7P6_9AGAR|nr:hypothetical protein BDN72DRAFT_956201 [Pluteus cervinus]